MLTRLAEFEHLFGPLRLFESITFRAIMAAITALLLGFWIAPRLFARLRALKMGQSLRTKEEVNALADLHAHKKDTPTMGGLMIFLAVSIAVFLWAKLNIYVTMALFVFTGLTFLGFADDFLKTIHKNSRGVSGKTKLWVQGLITAVVLGVLLNHPVSASPMRELWIPFYKNAVFLSMPTFVVFLLLFLVLSGSSNAINLTDGVDGLAIGCTVTVALAYSIMAYAAGNSVISEYLIISFVPGTGELSVICTALLGASLAFLWYNAHPAEVFMGDTGSLALGGVIGVIAFMIHQPFTLIIVGGIFVIEAFSVILQVSSYKLTGRRIFKMAPIHHHFELKGWHENKVVIRFWVLSLLFALTGLMTLKLR